METGLHNVCKECSKAYSESVGGRWIIYSPDGHAVLNITLKDFCQIKNCKTGDILTKDHIFPIAKGGTDNPENLQVLCRHHNFSKSDTLISPIIKSMDDIKEKMVCKRYLPIFYKAKKKKWSLVKFELEITKAVRELIVWKKNLSDEQLRKFFQEEKERNNRKHSVEHAVKKFRQYCETAILEANEYIARNNRVSKN
ncbi:MAG: HNH endonuclease [Nanoarchaeota archaeon]|nr:HNH endonuclease [Nanoarchaeota archaeon]